MEKIRGRFWGSLIWEGVCILCALSVLVLGATAAVAQRPTDTSALLRTQAMSSIAGKTIAFVPNSLGNALTDTWVYVTAGEAQQLGMRFLLRDPNWSVSAMTQAISALIPMRPNVLVVHNPNVQVLAEPFGKSGKSGNLCHSD